MNKLKFVMFDLLYCPLFKISFQDFSLLYLKDIDNLSLHNTDEIEPFVAFDLFLQELYLFEIWRGSVRDMNWCQ